MCSCTLGERSLPPARTDTGRSIDAITSVPVPYTREWFPTPLRRGSRGSVTFSARKDVPAPVAPNDTPCTLLVSVDASQAARVFGTVNVGLSVHDPMWLFGQGKEIHIQMAPKR